jgi:hypothetical protein
MLPLGSLALNLRFKSALKACVANGLVAVLIQNAVGSGTGGVGSGPDELTEVSVTPLRNDPDISMVIFPLWVFMHFLYQPAAILCCTAQH